MDRPHCKIVCLCGSTKFKEEYEDLARSFAMSGYIVLSVGCFSHADGIILTEEKKAFLDELHLRKIDLSDEVFIINKGGYIGESTQNELNYAFLKRKKIFFLEPGKVDWSFSHGEI